MNSLMAVSLSGASTPAISSSDITAATSSIFDVVSAILNEITSNPVFMIFFVSGLVFMGVRIIRNLKRV